MNELGERELVSEYGAENWMFIVGLGVLTSSAPILGNISYQMEETGTVGIIYYIGVFYLFLCDIFVFHQSFAPREILGCLIILTCNFSIAYLKYKHLI